MLYIKDGYPEVNEIVLCTVQKIYGNTTFVYLNEYEKEGVLTISEIAPGRIRNLRDHVIENKQIICKVLRVDEKNKRIDVSLRRVPIPVMKDKLEQIKKEEFSDKVYSEISKKLGMTKDDLFEKTYEPIFENYETVFEVLYEIMLENNKVSMFEQLTDKEKKVFVEIINEKIKPEQVIFKEKFNVNSKAQEGVEIIKNAITEVLNELNYEKINISYLAAGRFEIKITHDDIKSANNIYKKFKELLEKKNDKHNLIVKFDK